MTSVVISPSNVANFPGGGGHFWVCMQYVQGLIDIGVDVYWLEEFRPSSDADWDAKVLSVFQERMRGHGLEGKIILYSNKSAASGRTLINGADDEAHAVFADADLLLNFHYAIDPDLLAGFRRTALVDIDPGLLQFWMSSGQIPVPRHDRYLSIGETVGTPEARFPDCGLAWQRIRSPIWLPAWPRVSDPAQAFTTVSSWWGGRGGGEWVVRSEGDYYDNNKRVSFLEFAELPRRTDEILELALSVSDGVPIDPPLEPAAPIEG